jgi:hypothetical protein
MAGIPAVGDPMAGAPAAGDPAGGVLGPYFFLFFAF